MRLRVLIGAFTALATCLPASERANSGTRTTVCELLRNPDVYNGRTVIVDARIAWSEEGSVIFHESCSGSILFGLSAQGTDLARNEKQYRLILRLAKKRHIAAQVSGLFEHANERRWGHQAAWDSRILTTAVSNVRTMIPAKH